MVFHAILQCHAESQDVTLKTDVSFSIPGSMFGGSDRVLLSDIKVLTLHRGQTTKGRRSSPIPQLKCLGGSAQCSFAPETVQCINQGSDGFDVQVIFREQHKEGRD